MKHARGFFLALAILIMPNAAYYVFNWILVLKRQINEENFLRLPLYVDYIPEAIILVAMCLLIIYAVKDFTRAGKYGYMAAPTILLTNLAINSVVFMSIGHASILRHGLYDVSMVQGGGVVLHHRKYSVRNCRQKEVKTAYTTESLLSITTGRAGFFAI